MKTNISAVKLLSMTALLCAAVLVGCADYASVGVGYPSAYYVPDYTPFYAEYYYDGLPYWGPNITYIRKKVVVPKPFSTMNSTTAPMKVSSDKA